MEGVITSYETVIAVNPCNTSIQNQRVKGLKEGDDEQTKDACVGMTLRVQREIREALKVKHGLKQVTSGGEAVDLSDIEEV